MNAKGIEEQPRTMKIPDWDEGLEHYLQHDLWTPELACAVLTLTLAACVSANKRASFLGEQGYRQTHEEKIYKTKVNTLRGLWLSRGNKAPYEKHPPAYFIEWAISKNRRPDWLDWAIERGLYNPKPEAGAPVTVIQAPTAAKDTNSKTNGEPPGKMPRVTIGRLAVKAAWQIECQLNRKATANEVIYKLQEWCKNKKTADLEFLIDVIPQGVKWMTTKTHEKKYHIDACASTLKIWHQSRA